METIKEIRAEVLKETIQYYSQDPQGRRCVNGKGGCYYSPKTVGKEATSEGCAVGRLLPPELQEKLDRDYSGAGVSYDELFKTLPQEIQDLGQTFLLKLQMLHDLEENWNSEGLTETGEEYVKQIERVYCM